MNERQNTIVCTFNPASPRISAFEIHEWIHNHLRIPEQAVNMIQIDGTRRQVFIKLIEIESVQALFQGTDGLAEYKHTNGEVSTVRIDMAGMGSRKMLIANLYHLRWPKTLWGQPLHHTENYIIKGGIMVTNVSIRCSKWYPTTWNDSHETHHLPYDNHRTPSTNIICGSTPHLLRLRCNWTRVPGMSEEAWKRSGVDHGKYSNLCSHPSAWHNATAGEPREQDWGSGTHQTGELVGRPNGKDKWADTNRPPAPEWMHDWPANRTESNNGPLIWRQRRSNQPAASRRTRGRWRLNKCLCLSKQYR